MDDDRIDRRAAAPLPEERAAGTDVPDAQAEVILEESDQRTFDRDAAPDTVLEHRTAEDVTDPPA